LPSLVQQICMSGGLAISIAASHSRLRRRRHPQIFCQQPWLPPPATPLFFFHPSFIHQPVLNLLSILHPLTTSWSTPLIFHRSTNQFKPSFILHSSTNQY
jgi:hypothetical protein